MDEYVKRKAVIDLITRRYENPKICTQEINSIPAADVVPVVHARWKYIPQTLNTLSQLRCPFCGWWSLDPSIDGTYNYCPNCGALMDGGDGNEAD